MVIGSSSLKIKSKIEEYPNLVLEAHSTDYQSEQALTEMVFSLKFFLFQF